MSEPSESNPPAQVLSQDIDELNRRVAQLEQQLSGVRAEFDEFASIVSHDLRALLLSMTGCVELLAEQAGGRLGAEGDELIGLLLAGARRLNEMIKGLLEFSRAGSRVLQITDCPLEGALEQAAGGLSDVIASSGAQITHDPLPVVRADRTRMAQVFGHLIGNAIEFRAEAPPRIHISAKEGPREWTFGMRDNGIGIAPEHAERIFKVFQRLHAEDSPHKGAGMGLPMCKKILERHGGRIWVESVPGQGSTFLFTLPR